MHPAAGSLPAAGGRSRRAPITHQRAYWHHQIADLHAATPTVLVSNAGNAASSVGPAGVGERWDVQLVQVLTSSGLAVPIPTTAQVWRSISGVLVNLLMQTQNGGYDDLGVQCPTLTAGEQIAVVWSSGVPGDSAWATIRGTKYVLDDRAGQA
jgi:hypothetical protein